MIALEEKPCLKTGENPEMFESIIHSFVHNVMFLLYVELYARL